MNTSFTAILSHTPVGVWIGLAVLVAMGVSQMRDRDVPAARVGLVPLLLGGFSAWSVLNTFAGAGEALALAGWAAGAALGYASNRALDLPRRVSANADGSFRIAGSVAPLLLFLGIFALRYVAAVALAIVPSLRGDPLAALVVSAALAWPAGLLAARSRKIWATRGAPARTSVVAGQ